MKKLLFLIATLLLFAAIMLFETVYETEIQQWFTDSRIAETVDLEREEHQERAVEEVNAVVEQQEVSNQDQIIGLTVKEIKEEFGEPERIDLSAYGYDWWIYPQSNESYLQIGIENEKSVTLFLTGNLEQRNISLDYSYDQLNNQLEFKRNVSVIGGNGGKYQFELTDEDIKMRPLVNIDGNWVQFYFDIHTKRLSSVRVMTADVLVTLRPYSVSYVGEPPTRPTFTEGEWAMIEAGNARQIFDYTNIIRLRHDLEPFSWEEDVAGIAYKHSKDMSENNYFSHTSPTYGEVLDRFTREEVPFKLAGENIAAKYIDGIASVEGWLNSEGHRVNLLHEEFTHLGVGVFQDYYTQNFMTPWQM
ncbi:CAP domain-containing protein [Halalkalibacter krulwichiae]|uniref:Cysteine-rich secretory protein family protein n=1 Tax=Halalkalibacter krulwichiae TaxID=199441 RepID=A0A1X9MF25_9BACI|nr:CAP domain-containing protein [Halalkalibacter krulwichiae]ARK31130.1 Cysteine-rich secretory protein family protein [Halalkalibacter krulwichiae]